MFEYGYNKKYLYILLAVLVLLNIRSLTAEHLLSLVLTLPAVIIAITFHEYAHAFAADKLGDDTPRIQGRLNLNPISHIDPFGFVMLMFAGIGWGKPVEINPRNFNRNVSMEKGEAIVSMAGPLMNFILAIISGLALGALYTFASLSFISSTVGSIIYILLQELVVINIGLGVFNLLPFPPLDGSKIFINFMPYNVQRWLREHSQIFYIIFLILWISDLASIIISPIISVLYRGLMEGILAIFRLF